MALGSSALEARGSPLLKHEYTIAISKIPSGNTFSANQSTHTHTSTECLSAEPSTKHQAKQHRKCWLIHRLWAIPAKAFEMRSFFHSQGWSYSSGGLSSSWGSLLSREHRGSESPPFSAGSYGVSYRGSCRTGPSFTPRLPRISA